jgi:nucleoside-diphosphate-sugar epimerase
MRYLEDAVTDVDGISLRYGGFYGSPNDGLIEPVRKRQFPIIGDGGGVSSFVHLDDAAAATVLALERIGPAIYNIVDDDPAPVREWLPILANALDSKPPRPLPALARAARRRRSRSDDGNRVPRRLERESEKPARLDAALPQLAARFPRGLCSTTASTSEPRPQASANAARSRSASR